MDLSEEGGRDGEVGIARDDDDVGKDGADEELHPPGEDLNGKQSVGNKKRRKKGSGQLRDEGEEWAQKAQMWKSELDLVRAGWQEDVEDKEKKIKLLQTAMQGMQQQLLEAKAAQGDLPAFLLENKKDKVDKGKDMTLVAEWPPSKRSKSKEPEVSTCAPPPSANCNVEIKSAMAQTESSCTVASSTSTDAPEAVKIADQGMPGKDARSVAILSTFLSVLTYGVSTETIANHLVNMQEGIDKAEVELLLSRYPECFARGQGEGGSIQWRLVALTPVNH